MRKKQMLALFMSLSLLAQGMLFSGCGQKSIGEEPAQTRTETEEAQSMESSDSKKQDQTSETDENNQTAADKTQDQERGRKPDRIPVFRMAAPGGAGKRLQRGNTGTAVESDRRSRDRR